MVHGDEGAKAAFAEELEGLVPDARILRQKDNIS